MALPHLAWRKYMKYRTRDFGEIELDQVQSIEFLRPIFGYDEYQKFTLLFDEQVGRQIMWLQSLEESDLCFILADTSLLMQPYTPQLSQEEQDLLGEGDLVCLLMMITAPNLQDSTVNLRNPIIINTTTQKAIQALLPQEYPLRKKVFESEDA